jgi:hypothetical protein
MAYDLTQPADDTLAPGEARCPGPSTRDIIQRDQDGAPAALTAESWSFLGDEDIPYARYTSQSFYEPRGLARLRCGALLGGRNPRR